MPRPRRVPAYTLHKPSGQARVILDGRHVYLGPHGSPESREKYARLIVERLRRGGARGGAVLNSPRIRHLKLSNEDELGCVLLIGDSTPPTGAVWASLAAVFQRQPGIERPISLARAGGHGPGSNDGRQNCPRGWLKDDWGTSRFEMGAAAWFRRLPTIPAPPMSQTMPSMSSVHLICPHPGCHKPTTVAAERRGHVTTCPACGLALRVPLERSQFPQIPCGAAAIGAGTSPRAKAA